MRSDCGSFAEKLTGLFSDIVYRTMTADLLRVLDERDITHSQLLALTFVAEGRQRSIGSIAAGLGISHPAAVKLIEKLARKGLVIREPGVVDHRRTEVSVTGEGRELVNFLRRERVRRLQEVLDRLGTEERQALIEGLQAFVTAALRDERCLDALCASCQALLPTDCDDFRRQTADRLPLPMLSTHAGVLSPASL